MAMSYWTQLFLTRKQRDPRRENYQEISWKKKTRPDSNQPTQIFQHSRDFCYFLITCVMKKKPFIIQSMVTKLFSLQSFSFPSARQQTGSRIVQYKLELDKLISWVVSQSQLADVCQRGSCQEDCLYGGTEGPILVKCDLVKVWRLCQLWSRRYAWVKSW